LVFTLASCGGPSVVAYTRGLALEREADGMAQRNNGVDNKTRAVYFKAIEQYNSAINLNPQHALSYHHRGLCRGRIGQSEDAISDFSKAVEIDPTAIESWQYRADAYKDAQQFAAAIEDYNTAEKLTSDNDDEREAIYTNRAYCKRFVGDYKGALADAEKAVKISGSAANHCAVATIQRALGNEEQMDFAYEKALQANPHRVQTYQTRGFSEFIVKRYPQSLESFRTALRLSDWRGSDTPYAVLFGMFAARFAKNNGEAQALLGDAVNKLEIPTEVDMNAHNAMVADQWPLPAIQYFHGDITREKFLRAAQGDNSKMTEANCYLGLQALLKGDKKEAEKYFAWVKVNGRKDFIEYEVALDRLGTPSN
jgi:tetratricopeptide (TPR) repeat protein